MYSVKVENNIYSVFSTVTIFHPKGAVGFFFKQYNSANQSCKASLSYPRLWRPPSEKSHWHLIYGQKQQGYYLTKVAFKGLKFWKWLIIQYLSGPVLVKQWKIAIMYRIFMAVFLRWQFRVLRVWSFLVPLCVNFVASCLGFFVLTSGVGSVSWDSHHGLEALGYQRVSQTYRTILFGRWWTTARSDQPSNNMTAHHLCFVFRFYSEGAIAQLPTSIWFDLTQPREATLLFPSLQQQCSTCSLCCFRWCKITQDWAGT